jgi:hypothetical protein
LHALTKDKFALRGGQKSWQLAFSPLHTIDYQGNLYVCAVAIYVACARANNILDTIGRAWASLVWLAVKAPAEG